MLRTRQNLHPVDRFRASVDARDARVQDTYRVALCLLQKFQGVGESFSLCGDGDDSTGKPDQRQQLH